MIALGIVAAVGIAGAGEPAGKWRRSPCQDECPRAETEILRIEKLAMRDAKAAWAALGRYHGRYGKCLPNCPFGETESGVVDWLLDNRWDTFGDYVREARKRPGFKTWVLRGVPAFATSATFDRIAERARRECPRGARKECDEIRRAALQGAKDARSDSPPR